jgi:hypothetical protein
MRAIQRLRCAVRGGHRWETTEDPYGGITVCSRCGSLRHARGASDPSSRGPRDAVGGGGGEGGVGGNGD